MNNSWWVNFYEKCYYLWHIYLSINQSTFLWMTILTWFCQRKGKFLVTFLKSKWHFGILRKKLMEFTFDFYPSVGNENCKRKHTSRNGSKSWKTRFRKKTQPMRWEGHMAEKSQRNASSAILHSLEQAIWGHIWIYTVEKNQTNATSAILHSLKQSIWGHIWKHTVEKSCDSILYIVHYCTRLHWNVL